MTVEFAMMVNFTHSLKRGVRRYATREIKFDQINKSYFADNIFQYMNYRIFNHCFNNRKSKNWKIIGLKPKLPIPTNLYM